MEQQSGAFCVTSFHINFAGKAVQVSNLNMLKANLHYDIRRFLGISFQLYYINFSGFTLLLMSDGEIYSGAELTS